MKISRRSLVAGVSAMSLLATPRVRAAGGGKIVFWHSYTQKVRADFMRQVADRFESANPGTTVEIEAVPWPAFMQRWPAARAANRLPDVAVTVPKSAIPIAMANGLYPVTKVMEGIGGVKAFTPGIMDNSCKFGGEYIALPHYAHSLITVFRKDRLAEAGLPVPVTWQDALAAAVAMTKPPTYYGNILKLQKSDYAGADLLWALTRSVDGHFFDEKGNSTFDSDPVRKATEYLVEIGTKTSGPGIANFGYIDDFTLIGSGTESIANDSAAAVGVTVQNAPDVARNLDGTSMPKADTVGYLANIVGIVLPKGQNRGGGEAFLEFLFREENYMPLMTTIPLFMFPTCTKYNMAGFLGNPVIAAYPNVTQATLQGIERGVPGGCDFGLNPFAAPVWASGVVEEMLQRIILGNQPVKQEVTTASAKLEAILRPIRERL